MLCPKCGANVLDNEPVCPKCGTKVVVSAGNRGVRGSHVSASGQQRSSRAAYSQSPKHGRSKSRSSSSAGRYTERLNAQRNTGNHSSSSSSASSKTSKASSSGPIGANSQKRNRHQFTAAVLIIGAVLVGSFLAWDVWFRPYNINQKDFPSDAVRAAVVEFDADGSGSISREEAAGVADLVISSGTSVYGLNVFPNLKTLTIDSSDVTSVDVSKAAHIEKIEASSAKGLSTVKFGSNGDLSELNLANTGVTSLDLSEVPSVSNIDASYSKLSSLDVSGSHSLTTLDVTGAALSSLDVSGANSLSTLRCDSAVRVNGIGDTGMSEYWLIGNFQNNVPKYGKQDAQKIKMNASYDDDNRLVKLSYKNEAVESDGDAVVEYSYDDDDRITEARFKNMPTGDSDAAKNGTWTISYNDDGSIASSSDDTGSSFEYSYDEDGRLESCTVTKADGSSSKFALSYDDKGRLASMKEGESRETVYTYDSSNNLIEAVTDFPKDDVSEKDEDGETSSSTDSSSSEKSSASSSEKSSASSSASSASEGKADSKGSSSDTKSSDSSTGSSAKPLETYTFKYDSDGNCVSYTFNSQEYPVGQFEETYKYSADGSLKDASRSSDTSTTAWLTAHHEVTSSEYVYDSAGNLVSGALTRTDKTEGDHETFGIGYQRIFATSDRAPVSVLSYSGYPLASIVDDGESLASAVGSGSSVLTPWAHIPTPENIVFSPQTALFGMKVS